MKKRAGELFLVVCLAVITAVVFRTDLKHFLEKNNSIASVFFTDSVTEASLKEKYLLANNIRSRKVGDVNILIVPGHDKEYSGTEYDGISEAELTAELGEKIFALLSKELFFDTYISRTDEGYTPPFQSYFDTQESQIKTFAARQKGIMEDFVNTGKVKREVNVIHNNAPGEAAHRLYGINKWSNENKMDIVLHIHFNDFPGRRKKGHKYNGFAIYVPEKQYSNAKGSKSVAEAIQGRLQAFYPESNLPKEELGVVEDQELIAIGSNNSLDGAGMLIEYGYIYEHPFSDPESREIIMQDLALQTYLGIMDFFDRTVLEGGKHQSRLVPHAWESDLREGDEERDVVSLQAALLLEGVYPPAGKEKNDCSLTGHFGPCTEAALARFQEKYGISPAAGFLGAKTREKLNELYQL